MANERDKTESEKQKEGDRLDLEAYRNLHKAEFGFNPPDLTIENARAYFDDLRKQKDTQKQEQLKKDQLQKQELDKKAQLKKDQLLKDDLNKQDQLKKQQLQKENRASLDRLKKQQLQKDARDKQDRLKKQQLLEAALHARLTPKQIAAATRTREAKAAEAFTKAQKSLAQAAMLRQLSPETSEARNSIAKALDLVKQLPGKANALWPKEAKDHVRHALTILDRHSGPDSAQHGTNKFTKRDYDGSRTPIIPDYISKARWFCEQGVEHLKHEQFREAARDPAAAVTFFGQRPEWSRTGVPLDKPLDLKRDSEQQHEHQQKDRAEKDRQIDKGIQQRKDRDEQERRRAAFDTQEEAKDIRRKQLLTKADHEKPAKKEFTVFRDAKREQQQDKGRGKDQGRE